jgi:hypothetical protein
LLKMIVKNFFFYLPVKKQVKYLLLRKYWNITLTLL